MRKDAVYRMRVPRRTLAAIKRVAAANGEDASEWGRAIIETELRRDLAAIQLRDQNRFDPAMQALVAAAMGKPGADADRLVAALRGAFPADLDQVAIETADTPKPLHYTWRDLERGTAMLANLIDNALKYRDPVRPLRITVTGRVDGTIPVYAVIASPTLSLERLEALTAREPARIGLSAGGGSDEKTSVA